LKLFIDELRQESEDEINQLKFNIKTKKQTVQEIETEINSLELLKKNEEEKISEKDLQDKKEKLKEIVAEISKLENRKKRMDPKLKKELDPIQKTYTILNIIVNPSLDTNAKIINILQYFNT
jgi:septal ring factor EnvC (AmiA/AmiB activator)